MLKQANNGPVTDHGFKLNLRNLSWLFKNIPDDELTPPPSSSSDEDFFEVKKKKRKVGREEMINVSSGLLTHQH